MAQTHCGMDFGTSNTTMAVAGAGGAPKLIALEDGKVTLPSAMFFSFESEEVLFGRAGIAAYIDGVDGRLLRALKSLLGTALYHDRTRIKAQMLPFSAILGRFIKALKARSEIELGHGLDQVVVGRPVRFVDDDDAADAEAQAQLAEAVRRQGFSQIEFQFEPIAAALDYEQEVSREELALVIDIGGGTSDFSIIRLAPERREKADRRGDILATGGVHVGGTDFDRLLSLKAVMPQLGYRTMTADGKRPLPSGPYYDLATWHRINRLYNAQTLSALRQTAREALYPERAKQMLALVEDRLGHALSARVEDTKIALTHAAESRFEFTSRDVDLMAMITRDELDAALEDGVMRIDRTIAETLQKAGVGADAIDTLVLTGGSTQIPAILAGLTARFSGSRIVETDAFGSVGLGLALDASRRFS